MANQQRYKRSWKNYLLDANYQLRFTLTMLAVAAGLMAPLGYWVSQKAARSTEVALNQLDGIRCPDELKAKPASGPAAAGDPAGVQEDLLDEGAMPPPDKEVEERAVPEAAGLDASSPESAATETAKPAGEGDPAESESKESEDESESVDEDGERPRRAIVVDIDDSQMPTETPVVEVGVIETPGPTAAEIAEVNGRREMCLAHVAREKAAVIARKGMINTVMLVSGLVLLLGLAVYGIKTTHKVAGPLFKIGLYLAKLERNVYDTVYNLRQGDQLVEFYDHFKDAHAGATKMQEVDRDRLRDAIALAKDADLAAKDPELATLVTELETLLAETEKSLGQE